MGSVRRQVQIAIAPKEVKRRETTRTSGGDKEKGEGLVSSVILAFEYPMGGLMKANSCEEPEISARAEPRTTAPAATIEPVGSSIDMEAAAAAAAGDFTALFVQLGPYVASIGLRLLGRPDEVDDLVQDVFIAAYRGFSKVKDPRAIKGWLSTITVRIASRRLRRRSLLRRIGLGRAIGHETLADRGVSPEQGLFLKRVYSALDELPVNQRVPWVLRYIEGESVERIAEMCGISRATSYRRINAAHETVKKAVDDG